MEFSNWKLRIISYNIHNNETWRDFGLVPCGTSKLVRDFFLVRKCINNNKIERLNSWNEMNFMIYELFNGWKSFFFFFKSPYHDLCWNFSHMYKTMIFKYFNK